MLQVLLLGGCKCRQMSINPLRWWVEH